MPKILIDGDGCPVIDITLDIAEAYNMEVLIVCDTSHILEYEGVKTVLVDKGRDRADFVLLQYITKNDIIITQDYGLAALALSKQARALSQNGLLFTAENMDSLLASRHLSSVMRKHKQRSTNMKKRTHLQDEQFAQALLALLECA